MISSRFLKTSLIYTIAGVLPVASSVILFPVYQFYLPVDAFGALSIYTTFSMLMQVVVMYSFDSSLYVYFHEHKTDPERLAVFVSSAFWFMLMSGLVVSLVMTAAGSFLFERLMPDKPISFLPYGLMSVGIAVFQAIIKVYSSLLQSREKPMLYLWSNVITFSLICVLTIIGLMLFPQTLAGPVAGRLAAVLIASIWVLWRVVSEFGYRFDFTVLRSTFGYNNTTFIYQAQQWVINYADRYLMTIFLTLTLVGAYDFAFKCMLVLEFVFGGMYNSFYPKVVGIVVAQEKKQSTVTINRYYYGVIAVSMIMICAAIAGFPLLAKAGLIRQGYDISLSYLPFLAILYLMRSVKIYFNFPYSALRVVKPMPWIYLAISVIKIGLMLLFIRDYRVSAVIGSAAVSGMVEIILLRIFIRHRFTFHFNVMKLIVAPVLLSIVIVAGESSRLWSLADAKLGFFYRGAAYSIVCALLLVWMYRNEIPLMFSAFGKRNSAAPGV